MAGFDASRFQGSGGSQHQALAGLEAGGANLQFFRGVVEEIIFDANTWQWALTAEELEDGYCAN